MRVSYLFIGGRLRPGAAYSVAAAGDLNWDSSVGADGYLIYWGTTSQAYVSFQDVGNVTSYNIINLSPAWNHGTTYYWMVHSYNEFGESPNSAEASVAY